MIKAAQDVKKLGTILGIWAHPDDETYCSGGLIAAAAANEQKVMCIVATKGEKGVQDESKWPAAKLADIREKERAEAYEILGVSSYECLNLADGECSKAPDEQEMSKILDAVKVFNPDTIVTFGPDGLTGHTDHQAVSAWATKAGKTWGVPVYHFVMPNKAYELYHDACVEAKARGREFDDMFFNIHQPVVAGKDECDIYLKLSEELWQKKYAALKAMPSQTERFIKQLGPSYYQQIFAHEAFTLAK